MDTKIFYLHYILNFIDNEYKICNSLSETYCSESVLGLDSDSYHKAQGNCYQFIYTLNHCLVRLLKNHNLDKIEEKSWMKPYVQKNFKKILNQEKNKEESHVNDNSKIFYVREIDINIKREIFQKIVESSDFDDKEYTPEDVFFICYSYGFSFLDNKFVILKNILNLIIQDKFDLDIIYHEFFKYISSKNYESILFKKFNQKIFENKKLVTQFEVEQLLADNSDHIFKDDFLKELFHWKTKLANMLILIRQSFNFNVMINDDFLIARIYQNKNFNYVFNITFENIDSVMLLLANNYIISCISFNNHIKLFFSQIFNLKHEINLQIDISEFYIQLYGYNNYELINQDLKFNDFLSFLFQKIKKPITIFIDEKPLVFVYNQNIGSFEIAKKDENVVFDIDVLFLVSEKILISELSSFETSLKIIARIIINDFIIQEDDGTYQLFIPKNGKNKLVKKNGTVFNFDIIDHPLHNMRSENDSEINFGKIFVLYGSDNLGSQIIGLECRHQKYKNFGFICGIFDNEFSLFVLKSTIDDCKSEKMNDFITKISNLFKASDIDELKMGNFEQNFDSFDLQQNNNIFLIPYEHDSSSNDCLFESDPFTEKQKGHDYNQFCKLNFKSEDNIEHNLEIYHDVTSLTNKNLHKMQNSRVILPLPAINLTSHFYQFKIEKSNFKILVSRIIVVKSVDMEKSKIGRILEFSSSTLKIENCIVKFLTTIHISDDSINLINCELDQESQLRFHSFGSDDQNVKIQRSHYSKSIFIDQFLLLRTSIYMNDFHFTKKNFLCSLSIKNFFVDFLDDIPKNFKFLHLYTCHNISFKNNILLKKNSSLLRNIEKNSPLNNRIAYQWVNPRDHFILKFTKCNLPPNLRIMGAINMIEMVNCSSSFAIDSICSNFRIFDHQGEFSIQNIASKVVPKQFKNSFSIYLNRLTIDNLEIDCLQNIHVRSLRIINSRIQKISFIICTDIEIQNTQCSFVLIYSNQKINNIHNPTNLIIFGNEYMLLTNSDDSFDDLRVLFLKQFGQNNGK